MTPVILINYNRLDTTEKLIDQLLLLGYDDLYILDMGSTYEPLLKWYEECKKFTVIYHQNTGHKALWNDGILKEYWSTEQWVAVTDSDIELNINTPKGFIENMICIAKDFRAEKVGCTIAYKDISNPWIKEIIVPIESRYWRYSLSHPTYKIYLAPVDTTMCVVQPGRPFTYNAVRVGGDYTITHRPWYEDYNNLTEEQQYYHMHADPIIATGTQHYLNWKRAQQ